MGEWQDIATAPLDGTRVDLWVNRGKERGYRVTDALWDDGEWITKTRSFRYPVEAMVDAKTGIPRIRATHWMYAPEPPYPTMTEGELFAAIDALAPSSSPPSPAASESSVPEPAPHKT